MKRSGTGMTHSKWKSKKDRRKNGKVIIDRRTNGKKQEKLTQTYKKQKYEKKDEIMGK